MENTATATLVLGFSGTGKSYLAKSFAKASSLPAFVVNGSEEDFDSEKFEFIDYTELENNIEEYKNSLIIFDDVVRPTDKETKILHDLCVRWKRHGNISIFVNAHSTVKNNLHSLIKYFDYVVWTNSHQNTPIFKNYLQFIPQDKSEALHQWHDFIRNEAKTNYLRYSNKLSKFNVIDVMGTILDSDSESKLRKIIGKYIESAGVQVSECLAFFDYLIKQLPPNSVTYEDHILNLRNPTTNEKLDVNILDLVLLVPREDLKRPPPPDIIAAFKYLHNLYNLPYFFIGNKYFYDAVV